MTRIKSGDTPWGGGKSPVSARFQSTDTGSIMASIGASGYCGEANNPKVAISTDCVAGIRSGLYVVNTMKGLRSLIFRIKGAAQRRKIALRM